jgi:hypothetical protein
MINKYFDWVMRFTYKADNKIHNVSNVTTQPINRYTDIQEKVRFGSYKTGQAGPGELLALLLVSWPFIVVGVVAFQLSISEGMKFVILVIDILIMMIACIDFAIKMYKFKKTQLQMSNVPQDESQPNEH